MKEVLSLNLVIPLCCWKSKARFKKSTFIGCKTNISNGAQGSNQFELIMNDLAPTTSAVIKTELCYPPIKEITRKSNYPWEKSLLHEPTKLLKWKSSSVKHKIFDTNYKFYLGYVESNQPTHFILTWALASSTKLRLTSGAWQLYDKCFPGSRAFRSLLKCMGYFYCIWPARSRNSMSEDRKGCICCKLVVWR